MSYLKSLILLITASSIWASMPDSDLTNHYFEKPEILESVIYPNIERISENQFDETSLFIKLIRENGREEYLENLDLEVHCPSGTAVTRLDNKYFKIINRKPYEIQGNIECGKTNQWVFYSHTNEGQVLAIYDLAMRAVKKLREDSILSFWKSKITFKFPSDGDYYNWNTVNVTRGDHWDVVGHELGHAIYDQAGIGAFGGGSHKIDECYSSELALSEGWASYFSAWLSISLDDINAKFEYMVPRRAPIEIEYIPSDVCKGPRNEWRVTGFLWDIIDGGYDNENSKMAFSTFFKMTQNKDYRTINELANDLRRSGFDPILLNIIYEQNFLESLFVY